MNGSVSLRPVVAASRISSVPSTTRSPGIRIARCLPCDVVAHPEVERYHRGWGRRGDIGVVAELDGAVAGVAFCRLFTDEDHGEGYVDERTPEVAVGVVQGHRGAGIGGRLLGELADAAREAGFEQLSLSVDADNPARRLYERLGYRELSEEDADVLMVLEL